MATMIILRGISGSGKSTLAKKWVEEAAPDTVVVCSADNYFVDEKGHYNFNPAFLDEAHRSCFVNADDALAEGYNVIIDNTNCALWEVSPYLMLGKKHRAEVKIVRIKCNADVAARRNIHGVSAKIVKLMDQRMERALPFWPKEEVRDAE